MSIEEITHKNNLTIKPGKKKKLKPSGLKKAKKKARKVSKQSRRKNRG